MNTKKTNVNYSGGTIVSTNHKIEFDTILKNIIKSQCGLELSEDHDISITIRRKTKEYNVPSFFHAKSLEPIHIEATWTEKAK